MTKYKLIHAFEMGNIKLSLDIRLDKKESENTLTKLANELHKKQIKKYKRIFICYYLPDMIVNAGAWATSHFDPNLRIKILGCQGSEK